MLRLCLYEDLLLVLTQYERPFTHRGDRPGLHMFCRCVCTAFLRYSFVRALADFLHKSYARPADLAMVAVGWVVADRGIFSAMF